MGCARRLAGQDGVRVTLIDRNNYHQFQPLLYQVATSQLASSDVAFSLRKLFHDDPNVDVKMAEVASVDASARTVTTADGQRFAADALVLARRLAAELLPHPGRGAARLPAVLARRRPAPAVAHHRRLRGRRPRPGAARRGRAELRRSSAAAPTGVEIAGALADLIADTMSVEYRDLAVSAAQIHLVDHGHALLAPFSEHAHDYVAKVLARKGVRMHLGVAVTEVGPGHVTLADGTGHPDPMRHLGRRHQGAGPGRRVGSDPGSRRPYRRARAT